MGSIQQGGKHHEEQEGTLRDHRRNTWIHQTGVNDIIDVIKTGIHGWAGHIHTCQPFLYGTTDKTEQIMKHLTYLLTAIDYYGCETCTCDGRIEKMTFKMRCSRPFIPN